MRDSLFSRPDDAGFRVIPRVAPASVRAPAALLGAAAFALVVVVLLATPTSLPMLLVAAGALAGGVMLGARVRTGRAMAPTAPELQDEPTSLALSIAAVLIRTEDGTIRYWSPGAERLFGYPARGAHGRRAHELLRTRFAEGGRRAAEAELRRSGAWHGELRHRRLDGSVVTVASAWSLARSPGGEALIIEASTEATALKATEEELRASEGRLRLAQEVAEIGTWEWHPDSDEQDWSREQHALFGTDPDADTPPSVERLIALAHAEDRATLRAVIARAIETGEYEAEFRIQRRGRDGTEETRWIIGRGRRMPGPAGGRGVMLGMHVDITARKQAEMRQMLLIREVDHRAKNALAVVQAVLRLTRAGDQQGFVRAVEGRVAALARAQTLLANSRWSGADLRTLLDGELAPFLTSGPLGPGVTLEGPPVLLAPVITQPISMTVHELATNAVKHGALSTAGGQVEVRWSIADRDGPWLDLLWQEAGGPSLAGAPNCLGFGSRVLQTVVQDQLGGRIAMDWKADGLRCLIQVPLPASVAGAATCPT